MLGELGLPPSAARIAREVEAGIDPSVPVGFERGPSWRVKSVTVGEEEYPASAGTGVEMVETVSPAKRLYQNSCLCDHPEVAAWRCKLDNVTGGMGSGDNQGQWMAKHLVARGITNPDVVEDVVQANRIVNPYGIGTSSGDSYSLK